MVGSIQQVLMKDDINPRDEEDLQRTKKIQDDKNTEIDLSKIELTSLIKVGSFYEGTKISFPDEFDFIFLVPNLDGHHSISSLFETFDSTLKYVSPVRHPRRELYFDRYLGEHGPAFNVQFIYKDGSSTGLYKPSFIYMYVDIVPAVRFDFGDTHRDEINEIVNKVNPVSFREEVLKQGRCLRINTSLGYTFTETELHFIKNILSPKHVKVFKILKFLINGGDSGKLLEYNLELTNENIGYSSYQIKTLMIYHHEECENTAEDDIGDCVIKILQKLYQCRNTNNFPSIIPVNKSLKNCCLRNNVKVMIKQMKSMH